MFRVVGEGQRRGWEDGCDGINERAADAVSSSREPGPFALSAASRTLRLQATATDDD